jgi:hypothetical protein
LFNSRTSRVTRKFTRCHHFCGAATITSPLKRQNFPLSALEAPGKNSGTPGQTRCFQGFYGDKVRLIRAGIKLEHS